MRCRRAAELTTRELDGQLRWPQRVGLRLHTLLCPACRRFAAQVAAVDEAASRLISSARLSAGERPMPDVTRDRLERLVRDELAREG